MHGKSRASKLSCPPELMAMARALSSVEDRWVSNLHDAEADGGDKVDPEEIVVTHGPQLVWALFKFLASDEWKELCTGKHMILEFHV